MAGWRDALKRSPAAEAAARSAWRGAHRAIRPIQVRRLRPDGPLRVVIGAGHHRRPGWLNTDVFPYGLDDVYLDATRRFPFGDGTVDRIYAEHVIEHVPHEAGQHVLRECRRVLAAGGRVRLATPDIHRVVALLGPDDHAAYVRWSNETYAPELVDGRAADPVFAVNRLFHEWGHTFLYDEAALRRELIDAGLVDAVRCEVGESEDPAFRGIENHGDQIPECWNRFETLVMEATKPV
jgi:predicted SAM-dependent methyltransferase